jgi:serine/threonine-protein kinase
VEAWLDGAKRREQALAVVAAADAVVVEAAALREQAAGLRAEGEALLAPVPPWAPEEEKAAGWAKEDEAGRIERRAALLEFRDQPAICSKS